MEENIKILLCMCNQDQFLSNGLLNHVLNTYTLERKENVIEDILTQTSTLLIITF